MSLETFQQTGFFFKESFLKIFLKINPRSITVSNFSTFECKQSQVRCVSLQKQECYETSS